MFRWTTFSKLCCIPSNQTTKVNINHNPKGLSIILLKVNQLYYQGKYQSYYLTNYWFWVIKTIFIIIGSETTLWPPVCPYVGRSVIISSFTSHALIGVLVSLRSNILILIFLSELVSMAQILLSSVLPRASFKEKVVNKITKSLKKSINKSPSLENLLLCMMIIRTQVN